MRKALPTLSLLVLTTCGGETAAVRELGETQQGIATYYDATGAGNCSFDPSPDDMDVAAMNTPQWAGSAVCGACIQVDGPDGSVRVRIVDRCPECDTGHLDLSRQAFAKIARMELGRVPITWRLVSCPVEGNVRYHYKDGSNAWWTALQVRNHAIPVTKLEVQRNGAWVDVPRESYNYFVDSQGAGTGQVRVRITGHDGQTLEDTLDPVESDRTVEGAAQFR